MRLLLINPNTSAHITGWLAESAHSAMLPGDTLTAVTARCGPPVVRCAAPDVPEAFSANAGARPIGADAAASGRRASAAPVPCPGDRRGRSRAEWSVDIACQSPGCARLRRRRMRGRSVPCLDCSRANALRPGVAADRMRCCALRPAAADAQPLDSSAHTSQRSPYETAGCGGLLGFLVGWGLFSPVLWPSCDSTFPNGATPSRQKLGSGARQGSCRLIYAASGCLSSVVKSAATAQSRSGLSMTAPMGDPSRVGPDHRAGWRSRALTYSAWRAARMA